jgi:hypothetical protein
MPSRWQLTAEIDLRQQMNPCYVHVALATDNLRIISIEKLWDQTEETETLKAYLGIS